MKDSGAPFQGFEVWRGAVAPWQCDEMGHMNVRFYLAAATEGMTALMARLGMPHAFTAGATATILPLEHHIRFLREARAGAGLAIVGGVLEMGECDATLLQIMLHASGEPAAAFTVKVQHVTPRELRPFPWARAVRAQAEALRLERPAFAVPRSLLDPPGGAGAAPGEPDFPVAARGAIGPHDCDVFGRMLPEHVLARVYSSASHGHRRSQAAFMSAQPDLVGRLGGAVVEYRAAYHAWPRAGDCVELCSGYKALAHKSRTMAYKLRNPATGGAWVTAELVSLFLDLKARTSLTLTDEALAAGRAALGLVV